MDRHHFSVAHARIGYRSPRRLHIYRIEKLDVESLSGKLAQTEEVIE